MKQLDKLIRKDHSDDLRMIRKRTKEVARDVMLIRMLLDNIYEYIMPGFDIIVSHWRITLRAHKKTTVKDFYNQVDKIAKVLNKEPSKTVDKYDFNAWFWLFNSAISINITAENTEKCEIIVKEEYVKQEKYELTGYCKEIKEHKHLQYN
jgi:hypothetical protein